VLRHGSALLVYEKRLVEGRHLIHSLSGSSCCWISSFSLEVEQVLRHGSALLVYEKRLVEGRHLIHSLSGGSSCCWISSFSLEVHHELVE